MNTPPLLSKREGAAAVLKQCYRLAHTAAIYAGTSKEHRSVIAERGLGLPRTRA